MTNKEIEEFYQHLLKEKEMAENETKEEADAFLKRVGILTKSGNVAKPYNQIWKRKRMVKV